MTRQTEGAARSARTARVTALACILVAVGMTGLAFASVPLYALFCQATGFDGTPRIATGASDGPAGDRADATAAKPLTVHFDTNVSPRLTWRFRPETRSVTVVPGRTTTAFFQVTNTGSAPATGIAVFNVQPNLVGSYFVKVQCFCFEEHTLQPGETMEFPLVFYVDEKLRQDADIADLAEMTLSYTYYRARNGAPDTASAEPATGAVTRTNF